MKRSELNQILREASAFLKRMNFQLPPFADWTPEEWRDRGAEYDEIRDNLLGWDITDFGSGDFAGTGLLLFTLRNGTHGSVRYPKPYAEKIMIVRENQVTPYHFHWFKMEDIINRGGGNLLVTLYNATADEAGLADTPVEVWQDGRRYAVAPGSTVRLSPGQSITLRPKQYHTFRGEPGTGTALIGEVSQVNDDRTDNRFLEPVGRFPEIEEDEPPFRLLGCEYDRFIRR